MKSITEEINKICNPDLYEIGFSSLSGFLNPQYSKYKYGITLARKLDDTVIDGVYQGPTEAYYAHYHDVNNELSIKADEINVLLKDNNIDALPVKPTLKDRQLDEYYNKTLRHSFSHKMAATRSGIGWIGKTALLVTKRFGPRVRFATILTSKKVGDTGVPLNESQCGNCTVCVESCPAQAANGMLWNIEVDRDKFFDPFKCRDFCRKTAKERINKEISLCGICISVCPKGKK